MAKTRMITVPGSPEQKSLWRELYDHTAAPVVDWAFDHKLASTALVVATAGAITLGTFLSTGGSARNVDSAQSTPNTGQTSSSQTVGQTASEIYYSQVRASLLQDVPELANYRSALDYTTQRIVDMKNVYGLTLEQVRAPVKKWVETNIEWDKQSERLISLTEEVDFIPDMLFGENGTFDYSTRDINRKIAADTRPRSERVPVEKFLADNVDSAINGHDEIWADLHNPQKLERYLEIANNPSWFIPQGKDVYAQRYKAAMRNAGTFSDRAHLALTGRAMMIYNPGSNEELNRNEVPFAMILAVGGKAQIAQNVFVKELDSPAGTEPSSKYQRSGDRQLALGISNQLEQHIHNDPEMYGHPLDNGYLQPNISNLETVEQARPLPSGYSLELVYRENPHQRSGESNRVWLIGNATRAKEIGW